MYIYIYIYIYHVEGRADLPHVVPVLREVPVLARVRVDYFRIIRTTSIISIIRIIRITSVTTTLLIKKFDA